MSKPIQEQIFKSRLSITYRTNITGTVQQERLPYRLLVLGKFAGKAHKEAGEVPDLAERRVRSIVRGTTVNDHLRDMVPVWRIPDRLPKLRSTIPGTVVFGEVTFSVPASAKDSNQAREYAIQGEATFTSDHQDGGNPLLKGKLRVSGTVTFNSASGGTAVEDVKIGLRGLLSSPSVDPSTQKVDGIVTACVRADGARSSASEEKPDAPFRLKEVNKDHVKVEPIEDLDVLADPSKPKRYKVTIQGAAPFALSAERTVPFMSLTGFEPDSVVANVPELRRLVVIKDLLLQLQSTLSNRPDIRKQLKEALPPYGAGPALVEQKLTPFVELQTWMNDEFPLLKIARAGAETARPDQPPPGTPDEVKKEIADAVGKAETAAGGIKTAGDEATGKATEAKTKASESAQAALKALAANDAANADAKTKSGEAKEAAKSLRDAATNLTKAVAAAEAAIKDAEKATQKGSTVTQAAAAATVALARSATAAAQTAEGAASAAFDKVTAADSAIQAGVTEAAVKATADAAFSVVDAEGKLKDATTAATDVTEAVKATKATLPA